MLFASALQPCNPRKLWLISNFDSVLIPGRISARHVGPYCDARPMCMSAKWSSSSFMSACMLPCRIGHIRSETHTPFIRRYLSAQNSSRIALAKKVRAVSPIRVAPAKSNRKTFTPFALARSAVWVNNLLTIASESWELPGMTRASKAPLCLFSPIMMDIASVLVRFAYLKSNALTGGSSLLVSSPGAKSNRVGRYSCKHLGM
mmetsp:Transcript_86616/g.153046  ORF Transcript_86616/g.153046 Transcript_86616/m.153046 type:complete len:203 (-) Transcript_86616:326-934(-)